MASADSRLSEEPPHVGAGAPVAGAVLAAAVAFAAWTLVVGQRAHLLHFDAKAHLLVARRVLDNLTPGWTQLGAVWLPLPHILNVLPSASDALYQSGLFASALSFVFFVAGVFALGAAAARATGDRRAGLVAMAVPAMNPGWLYLQATPMTEPLFLGLVGAMVLFVVRFRSTGSHGDLAAAAASSALACLVRYEAWPVALGAAVVAAWPSAGERWAGRARRVLPAMVGAGLVLPVLGFGVHTWVASKRFMYVIDDGNLTERGGEASQAAFLLAAGIADGFGLPLAVAGAAALAALALRPRSPLLWLAAACLGPALVTLTAYLAGHPTKARYPLLLAPAFALALAAVTRGRPAAQLAALALAALQPLEAPDPLPVLREATRDRRAVAVRRPLVEGFARQYQGGGVLASMGSLAPVLFETRLPLREFVHEGNGSLWDYAAVDPWRHVRWVMVADGDVLDQIRLYRRAFPEGFVPVWRGASITLYARAGRPPAFPR